MDWRQQQENEEERRYLEEQALEEIEKEYLSGHDAICDCGDEDSHNLQKKDPAYHDIEEDGP